MRILKIVLICVFVFGVTISVLEPQEAQEPQEIQETQDAQPVAQGVETTEPPAPVPDMKIGSVRIPRPFIHAEKDYEAGIYIFTLTEKDGTPYFNVYNPKQELLFSEMAIVKPKKNGKKGSKFRVKKGFIDNYEYFRLKVLKPDQQLLAFLLVKK
jgi:hypothetical protein